MVSALKEGTVVAMLYYINILYMFSEGIVLNKKKRAKYNCILLVNSGFLRFLTAALNGSIFLKCLCF